jgi:hypothetical protein
MFASIPETLHSVQGDNTRKYMLNGMTPMLFYPVIINASPVPDTLQVLLLHCSFVLRVPDGG